MNRRTLEGLVVLALLGGCSAHRHYVVAATGTVIGVEVAKGTDTQTPHAKLGYNRAEVALVPTNRRSDEAPGTSSDHDGADESVDVLMELRYGGIFDLGASSGIYQRLAVGRNAVQQPGAALMFARDADSEMSRETAEAVGQSFALDSNRRLSTRGIVTFLESVSKGLADQTADARAQELKAALDAYAGSILPATYDQFSDDPADTLNVVATPVTPSQRDLTALMAYLGVLDRNKTKLEAVEQVVTPTTPPKINGTPKTGDDLASLRQQTEMAIEHVRAALQSGQPAKDAFDYYVKLLTE